jgi:nucleotide-binding universal stress UspA family protein
MTRIDKEEGMAPNRRDSRRFLIAVDDSENSRRSVRYAADLLRDLSRVEILLLHIAPEPDDDFFHSADRKIEWMDDYESRVNRMLLKCREMLIHRGIKAEHIQVGCRSMAFSSVAESIMEAGREFGSGTIIIGRRGISQSEEFLFGSTSSRIVQHARNCTVWLVE